MNTQKPSEPIHVVGAGIAGLTAAITLAQAGRQVQVHEARSEPGGRFTGDLQGLENWSHPQDVLEWLEELRIATSFATHPCHSGQVFDAWGKCYPVHSDNALFYMIERGSGPRSLDTALLQQAQSLGVEINFKDRQGHLSGPGILAAGPKAADALAAGYHFDTGMENGFWAILDDTIAPNGYSYLLVMNGRGTVKSCMFSGFKQESEYVKQTVDRFERLVGLEMKNPVFHGGAGNFRIPARAVSGGHPVVGEQAGFQDFLWGFGMRYAVQSGVLAARSLLEGKDYEQLWRQLLLPQLRHSQVNRALYAMLGNSGYRWFLKRSQAGHWDAYRALARLYRPSLLTRVLEPWGRWRVQSQRQDVSCNHVDCHCIWCRHGAHSES